jgi:hypothetical protein
MAELEDQLRDTVNRRMRDYAPSADLRQRIETRVRQRRRRRRLAAAALSTGVVTLAVIVGVVAVRPSERDREEVAEGGRPDRPTTVVTDPDAPSGPGEQPPTTATPGTAPTTEPAEPRATSEPPASDPPSSTRGTTATTSTPGTVATAPDLKPADGSEPTVRGCNRLTAPVVEVVLNADRPAPACVRVTAGQRLRVRNASGEPVTVSLAGFQATLAPGTARTYDRAFGDYLQPGVHRFTVSLYGARDPEIWLAP